MKINNIYLLYYFICNIFLLFVIITNYILSIYISVKINNIAILKIILYICTKNRIFKNDKLQKIFKNYNINIDYYQMI